jgi:NhaA family Na+:H+ antiporter
MDDESLAAESDENATGIEPNRRCPALPHWVDEMAEVVEKGTVPSMLLIVATAVSLTLANVPATSAWWLRFWATHVGPSIGGHALSIQDWVNEGLMAIFFFVVGLEIKREFRVGSLASVKKAILPCFAAVGGMVTPMGVYYLCQKLMSGGSLAALAVPMATDIAFATGVLGFFRSVMPLSATAFLLTLATVDDLGAIVVLATCFAGNVAFPFLWGATAILAALAVIGLPGVGGRWKGASDMRIFAAGGISLWYCLLRSGVNSDVAGVLTAMCISTRTNVRLPSGKSEPLTARVIRYMSPLTAFLIMPIFALANTAVRFGGASVATGTAKAAAAAAAASSKVPAIGIALGLVIGKPLGIFGFTWLCCRLGLASLPDDMNKKHLGVVGMLGGIGFTMCLLLTEVALPEAMQTIPKLAVLGSSAFAAVIAAVAMAALPKVNTPKMAT